MSKCEIPKEATARQTAAADPERSVFVSANAGSGKTHVLVQRVINLLLRGEDPAKILCITFTKAAAANMATRVFNTLAEWTALDDKALDAKIAASTGKPSSEAQRATARRLFATALETPGGLKVQTIHAFCTRLLHQFPFEADVAARFEVLDDATTAQLLNHLTLDVILKGANDPDSDLGRSLANAISSAADLTFKEVIAEAIRRRDLVTGWIERAGTLSKAIAELAHTLGLTTADTLQAIENEYFSGSLIPEAEWPDLMAALAKGSAADKKHIDALQTAREAVGKPRLDAYLSVYCNKDRTKRSRILTKAVAERHPDWATRLADEQERVCGLIARENAVRARDRSAALVTVAAAVIERYAKEKERRGYLDYEDLIAKTLTLFNKVSAAWVLYKLDLGVNHILVDEAQDTSPQQWDIISTIAAEFPPGGSRDNTRRTLFAVGDEKQSIFSFQGAAPHAFAEMRDKFARLFTESGAEFGTEKLDWSFRSATGILEAVDGVFEKPEAFKGLSADPTKTVHRALPAATLGEVEIWDLIKADKKDASKEGWDAPFDLAGEKSPAVKLAAKIARTVKQWIADGSRAGEALVLVRQRGALFEAVIRALKHEGVNVAGADRLFLTEHIAIMDLLVLGDALLLPDDDLALATALKSPLFGLNDEQIYTLAYGRKWSLRASLRAKADSDPMFAAASRMLDDLAAKARIMPPFAFYAHVLGALNGRKHILERLGVEASDPLDEFLNLTIDYERRETPSLQGFLNWIRAAQSEVKRDMEIARDEVRVMTVHGAKGLEAKNVILCDVTTVRPEGAFPPRLLTTPVAGAPPGAKAMIWATGKDRDAGPMAAARAKILDENRDEYRRLLYVGLTRAAERLIVCGTAGVKKPPEGCWHTLVVNALAPQSEEAEDADGKVWRFRKGGVTASEPAAASRAFATPSWLRSIAKPEAPAIRIDRPSDSGDDEWHGGTGEGRDKALKRGTLMHRLFQALPDIPAERRADAAQRYLAHNAKVGFTDADRNDMQRSVLAVLGDPQFAHLFGPGSRAEVSVTGTLMAKDGPRLVAGQIDRLFADQSMVFVVDYKTSRQTNADESITTPMYVRQLALYRAVLAKIYPQHTIRCALLWTEVPVLKEISADELDAALASHLGVTAP